MWEEEAIIASPAVATITLTQWTSELEQLRAEVTKLQAAL